MIPANQRKKQKNKLQQQRGRNGAEWEQTLCEELDGAPGCWARRWPKAYAGQPFDISAQLEGRACAIECKSIARGNLPFSALRPNEIENLSRFEDAGGCALVAIRRQNPPERRFVPWCSIREKIESGDRGSVALGGQPQSIHEALGVERP